MNEHRLESPAEAAIAFAGPIPQQHQLCVRRIGAAWCVEGDGFEHLMFRAGSQAELQARGLAKGFASCGGDTCVRVHDAQGLLVAVIRYYGEEGMEAGAGG